MCRVHPCCRFEEQIGSLSVLQDEVKWLQELISAHCHSPIVYCHNDTLIANFIYDRETGRCTQQGGTAVDACYKVLSGSCGTSTVSFLCEFSF